VICETVPFINGSSDQLQTQDQDSQYYSAPIVILQDFNTSVKKEVGHSNTRGTVRLCSFPLKYCCT
jgi:hypothetical protein